MSTRNEFDTATLAPVDPDNIPQADLLLDLWEQHGEFNVAFAAWMERLAAQIEVQEQYPLAELEAIRCEYRMIAAEDARGFLGAGLAAIRRRDRQADCAKRILALLRNAPSALQAAANYLEEPLDYFLGLVFRAALLGTTAPATFLAIETALRDGTQSWTTIAAEHNVSAPTVKRLADLLGIVNPKTARGGMAVFTQEQRARARELWAQGFGTHAEIAAEVGATRTAVTGWCRNIKTEASEAAKRQRAAGMWSRKRVPRHGTRREYARGCRCDECRRSESTYQIERRRKRKQKSQMSE